MNVWMKIYIERLKKNRKKFHKTLRQIHTVYTRKLSQAKATKGLLYQNVQTVLLTHPFHKK